MPNVVNVTSDMILVDVKDHRKNNRKLEKKYAPALDNYGQSGFVTVRSDFLKMRCVCKTQMMPPPDHQNPVDMHGIVVTSNPAHGEVIVYNVM
jgi:hypothetical protein